MRLLIVATLGVALFVAGFFLGQVSSPSTGLEFQGGKRLVVHDPARAAEAPDAAPGAGREARRGDEEDDEERPEDRETEDPGKALAAVKAAIAAGDRHGMHEALGLLHRLPPGALSSEEIAEWTQLIRDGDPRYTQDVAHALMRVAGAEGAKQVLEIVRDEDLSLELRRELLHSFGALRPEEARKVTPLLEDYLASAPGGEMARVAAQMYGRLQGEEGFSQLLSLVTGKPELRSGPVLDALGELGGPGDIKQALGLLGENLSHRERRSLLHAAGRMAARNGEEGMLLDLLESPPEGVSRRELARVLGDAAQSAPLSFLEDALIATHGDREAQESIAHAMANRGGKDALDRLLAAAENPDVGLEPRTLARALSEFRDSEAVPAILDLLAETQDPEEFRPLARGLFEHGDSEQVASLLEQFTRGGNRSLQRALADSLAHADLDLGIDRYVDLISRAQDDHVAERLGDALRRSHGGDPERLNELLETTANSRARLALLRALEDSPQPAPLGELARGLESSHDGHELWQYTRLLSGRGQEGLGQIGDFLANEGNGGNRHSVLEGLLDSRRMSTGDARDVILDLAGRSASPGLRQHAIKGLAERSDGSILPDLSDLLAAELDPEVQQTLRSVIEEIASRER